MTVEKRKPLTRREVIELCLRQEGRCGCGCGFKLDPMGETVIDEHWIALELGGSNDLTNRYLLRKPCAVAKTAKRDAPAIAKVKRIEARINGTRRARKPIPQRVGGGWPPKGSRKLPTKKTAPLSAPARLGISRSAATPVQRGGEGWQPIETAPRDVRAILFTPAERLYEKPHPDDWEMRVARPRDWGWATHWMPLPSAPNATSTAGEVGAAVAGHTARCWGRTSYSDEMAHCYCAKPSDADTLAVLLDNVVMSQRLSRELREQSLDQARSYLYGRRQALLATNGELIQQTPPSSPEVTSSVAAQQAAASPAPAGYREAMNQDISPDEPRKAEESNGGGE